MLLSKWVKPGVICGRRYRHVRIGCASAFWGDTAVSTPQFLFAKENVVNYIVYDYLSEITMSLLARVKGKNPKFGYCPDFIAFHMSPNLQKIKEKGYLQPGPLPRAAADPGSGHGSSVRVCNGVKIIANSGGLNPISCAAALTDLCKERGIPMNIAAVTGDDLMEANADVKNSMTSLDGSPVPSGRDYISLNAYLGAEPIVECLKAGADVVITGRCVDSALTLAPLMYEFGWTADDLEAMAIGSLAGHLIECGAQATGGIFTDWRRVADQWSMIGFPIVEFDSDSAKSKFIITKPDKTGGEVSRGTVAEQLVYEIDNPAEYKLPDVVADFTDVRITETGDKDRVMVTGVRGLPAADKFKVTGTYMSGYRCTAVCPIIGPDASEKAYATAHSIIHRCRMIFKQLKMADFSKILIQTLGSEQTYNVHHSECREIVLWIAVEHEDQNALGFFSREIAPAGTGMAPGLTNIIGGRPKIGPIFKHDGLLVPKKDVNCDIYLNGERVKTVKTSSTSSTSSPSQSTSSSAGTEQQHPELDPAFLVQTHKLSELVYTRSGDKGDTCNIGVVCRDPVHYAYLKQHLTAEVVADYFAHFMADRSAVVRYSLPGIHGFNFVLPQSLGGGGIASLRVDPQGKGYGQMLLDLKLPTRATKSD